MNDLFIILEHFIEAAQYKVYIISESEKMIVEQTEVETDSWIRTLFSYFLYLIRIIMSNILYTIGIFVLIIIAFVVVSKKTKKRKSSSRNNADEVIREKHGDIHKFNKIYIMLNQLDTKIQGLHNEILIINGVLKKLQDINKKTSNEHQLINDNELTDPGSHYKKDDENISKEEKNKRYYISSDKKGRFNINYGRQEQDDDTYYLIIYDDHNSEGEIHYMPGPRDAVNADSRDRMLYPVCEIVNNEKSEVNNIQMVKSGTVELLDDCWQIKDKITIKLI